MPSSILISLLSWGQKKKKKKNESQRNPPPPPKGKVDSEKEMFLCALQYTQGMCSLMWPIYSMVIYVRTSICRFKLQHYSDRSFNKFVLVSSSIALYCLSLFEFNYCRLLLCWSSTTIMPSTYLLCIHELSKRKKKLTISTSSTASFVGVLPYHSIIVSLTCFI